MARFTATLVLALVLPSAAWAANTPGDALRRIFHQANVILADSRTDERPVDRLLAIRKLVNEAFDFRGAAELATGERWRARTLAEQEEFTWLFADLLERSFVGRMASTARLKGGMRIRYLGELIEGGTAVVQTAMMRRDGGEMLLDYEMVERKGGWKVRDVAVDGVSLMANYRAQLDRVLGHASFPELLTQMRAKVGAIEPPPLPPRIESRAPAPAPPAPVGERPSPRTAPALQPPPPVMTVTRPPRTKAYWLRISTLEADVLVGPFRDAEEAVLELLVLQAKGHDPYLVAERE